MLINKFTLFICFILCSNYLLAQKWPVDPKDDPKDWNTITCTFGEIHKTGKDHIHCGVDIDVNRRGCPIRAVQRGRVYDKGHTSISLEHEYPAGSGKYNRRTRYLHTYGRYSKDVKVGAFVEAGQKITRAKSNRRGFAWHLHFEMWQKDNGIWYALNPFRNDTDWAIKSPKDSYDPEINDIFLMPIDKNGNPSGFSYSSKSRAIKKSKLKSLKVHFKNRPKSSGPVYKKSKDKVIVFGDIAPIVSVRDRGLNCLAPSGAGLTVYRLKYSIDKELKYDLTFDRIEKSAVYEVDNFFERKYVRRRNDRYNGNNDYLKLFCTSGKYFYPQKLIKKKRSDGIWQTKASKKASKISNKKAAPALLNSLALYPDGEHLLQFETYDATLKKDRAEMNVIVDNFAPFVEKVNVYPRTKKSGKPLYSMGWKYNDKSSRLVLVHHFKYKIEKSQSIRIQIRTSEPMSRVQVTIPELNNYSTIISKPDKNSGRKVWSFTLSAKTMKKNKTKKLTFSINGSDLAGNELFAFPSKKSIEVSKLPRRNSSGEFINETKGQSDKIHFLEIK